MKQDILSNLLNWSLLDYVKFSLLQKLFSWSKTFFFFHLLGATFFVTFLKKTFSSTWHFMFVKYTYYGTWPEKVHVLWICSSLASRLNGYRCSNCLMFLFFLKENHFEKLPVNNIIYPNDKKLNITLIDKKQNITILSTSQVN